MSAKMFAFLTFHFCKRYQTFFLPEHCFPEPYVHFIVASVSKATPLSVYRIVDAVDCHFLGYIVWIIHIPHVFSTPAPRYP